MRKTAKLAIFCVSLGLAASAGRAATGSLEEFRKTGEKFKAQVSLPVFETEASQIQATVTNTIAQGNAALDKIAAVDLKNTSFANTSLGMDDMLFNAMGAVNRLGLIKETSKSAAVRDAATDGLKALQDWAVSVDYREDVYKVMRAFADSKPKLDPVQARLLEYQLRDFRRAGLALSKEQRDRVEKLRKELAMLETDFLSNVTKAEKSLKFSGADLRGVPASFLEQIKTGNDQYTVMANVTFQYQMVMENADKEETRKELQTVRNNLAKEENTPLAQKILTLRYEIAKELGYKSWADFQTEIKMARNAATAIDFLKDLNKGLQPKFDAEIETFRAMKAKQTGNADAKVYIWDWRYFANQLKKEKYSVDAEQLRVYFPMDATLNGMFAVYQKIFGLKFERLDPPQKWVDDLQLWGVTDAKTGEPMGLFYLDLFPREGKYNHFACFGVTDGKRLRSGIYQRPVVALVCNFPTPANGTPSLLSHEEVETLFHEFGHAMHGILTRVDYVKFSGSSVPGDFVEAPSQMLEHWVWDKNVLDSFAADYRDPSKKIPAEIIAKLWEARMSTEGTRYRRQLSFGLTDLVLHTEITSENADRAIPISNKVLSDVFFPRPEGTAFLAYLGHFVGYDAGYYGYAWADAIAADMGTVFTKAPGGLMDANAGMKLRNEIYAVGNSRDANESIRRFLGRDQSLEPFLNKIGIKTATK